MYYIIGDNRRRPAEGTLTGTFNAMMGVNGGDDLQTVDFMVDHKDEIGSPTSYPHYAVGLAHALCTPYQWTKQVASHWGGTRNATIVHWPRGIAEGGGMRHQFTHVIDVAPTILEAAGLPAPATVHGVTRSRCTARAWSTPSTRPTLPSATRRSTSRCSATAASTTRASRR